MTALKFFLAKKSEHTPDMPNPLDPLLDEPLEIRIMATDSGTGTQLQFDEVKLSRSVLADPIADAGGSYGVASPGGSLFLDGSSSLASGIGNITLYEWDLDNDGFYDDATGVTPAAISDADLIASYGMAMGANTIGLKVTDSDAKTATESTTVNLTDPLTTHTASGGGHSVDTWNNPASWDSGVPTGMIDVAIGAGNYASVNDQYVAGTTGAYTGTLTLEAGALLEIGHLSSATDLNALGTGTWTLNTGSEIRLRRADNTTHANDIDMAGDAKFTLGTSTSAHHRSRTLTGVISGSGQLTTHVSHNNTLYLQGNSPLWSGGLVAGGSDDENKSSRIEAESANAFGTGDVTLEDGMGLQIDVDDAIGNGATLTLNGGDGSLSQKIVMNADDTVNQLFRDGVQLPAGPYTGASASWIGGSATLTVLTGSTETVLPTVTSWGNNVSNGPIYADQAEVTYTVNFDEDISTTLTTADFLILGTGGASGTVTTVTKTSDLAEPASYTVVVEPSGTGTIQLQIPVGRVVVDLYGNALLVPASDPLPTITINAGTDPSTGDRFWDGSITSGITDGVSQGGTANWDTTTTNWDRGVGFAGPVAWNNANDDNAVFGGSPGTVTVSGPITLRDLTFNTTSNTDYIIDGGTLNFSAGGTIDHAVTNKEHTVTSAINGNPTVNIAFHDEKVYPGGIAIYKGLTFAPTSGTATLGTANVPPLDYGGDKAALWLGGTTTGNSVDTVQYAGGNRYGSLYKKDSGTWTVGNVDIGTCVIEDGTLIVNGTLDTHYQGFFIVSTGRLAGNGTIVDPVTVPAGCSIAPGTSVGTLSVSSNTAITGGTIEIEVDGATADVLAVTGDLDLTGGTILVTELGAATLTDYLVVTYTGTRTGTFATETLPAGYSVDYTTPNEIHLVVSASGATYASWAASFLPGLSDLTANLDFDSGGLETGIEWVVGGDPTDPSDDAGNAPTGTDDGTYLVYTYNRSDESEADTNTTITVKYGSDLTGWTTAVHETAGVVITVTDGAPFDIVTVKIPKALAVGAKLFARLDVVIVP